jgi:hypothetical protein
MNVSAPDRYREAENLLAAANQRLTGNDAEWLHTPSRRAELRAEAQVRATLFLGAATVAAEALKCGFMTLDEYGEWIAATGIKPEAAATEAATKEDDR